MSLSGRGGREVGLYQLGVIPDYAKEGRPSPAVLPSMEVLVKFVYKVTSAGMRLIRAEKVRDGQTFYSTWKVLPEHGLGIEQRKEAWAEAIERCQEDCENRVEQVYGGKRS